MSNDNIDEYLKFSGAKSVYVRIALETLHL